LNKDDYHKPTQNYTHI